MSNNFRITEDLVLGRGAKTKARENIAAIKLLQTLERDQRRAEAMEQAVLARYVGWGGIPQIFNPTPDLDWAPLAAELKELLEPSEYSSAFESVLNAHYTSFETIREIYRGLEHLGFQGGRILEPSMGVGNFLGLMPEEMAQRSEVTGIELDSITGRIAQQLYPDHEIYVQGFEKSSFPKDYFDLAISNVPFGDYKIHDPEYNDLDLKIHNYFFARALDRVRPGGLVCFVTSTGTMQAKTSKGFRAWMAERANLVGAMRLPGDAFKTNAGTEVTTDLIVLQKVGAMVEANRENWMDVVGTGLRDAEGNELLTNEYYVRHPERMLGIPCDDKLHPGRLALESQGNTIERMREAFASFPSNIYERSYIAPSESDAVRVRVPPNTDIKNYGYLAQGTQIWQRRNDWLYPTQMKGKTSERVRGLLQIRDAVHEVFEIQIRGGTDLELSEAQERLNQTYDEFVGRNGRITESANARAFREDPDAQLLLALEVKNEETKEIHKADVFHRRTVRPRIVKESAQTPQEALLVSLNEYSRVVPGYMAQLLNQEESEVLSALQEQELIYQDPVSEQWQTQDEYLAGDVRRKLSLAQTAIDRNPQFQRNVKALEAVQPRDLGPGEIEVRLGSPWLPTEVIEDFALDLLEKKRGTIRLNISHSSKFAVWAIDAARVLNQDPLNNSTHGTGNLTALDLLELSLNLKDAKVYDRTTDGELRLDEQSTLAARMKQDQLQERFKGWIWQDFERSEKLCRLYNDLFNGQVIRQYRNPNLEMPGSSPQIELRAHQKDAVWRTLQSQSTMLAHVVGSGKTFTMAAGAIEMRRLGIAQKPMIVVPNHMLGQFTRELYQLYPNAKVLAPGEKDTQAKKRKELMAKIATGDWDAVIVTHSAFVRLPISETERVRYYEEQLEEIESLIGDSDVRQGNSVVKQLARERKKLQERIDRISHSKIKDDGVTFEQLGVDALFVDEAHFWKNLGRNSKLQNIAGLSNTNSQRAMDAFMKCRLIRANGGRLVFATGTPISNSIAELYTMQRFLQPEALERQGIENFDAWVGAFAEKVTAPEIDATGRFKIKTRLTKFTNIPELMTLFRQVADIKTAEQLNLPRPIPERLTVAAGASSLQLEYMDRLITRAERIAARTVEPDQDNMLWVTTDGRRAALDPRLISKSIPDYPHSKVNQAIANIEAIWSATQETRSAQMVFCDMGTPKKAKEGQEAPFSIYQHIKDGLIARGIPADEIAFIHDAPKSKDKEALFAAVREGRVRVLIGSTEKCGVGMNVQERLIAEHHLDPPWRPSDIEQREGRILRQGNQNSRVLLLTYVTQGRDGQLGFDSYSWQTLARKAEMVAQIMNGDTSVRSVEDVSSSAMSFDEIKAIATGNPLIVEKATVDNRVVELSRYKQAFLNERYMLQSRVSHYLPNDIEYIQKEIRCLREDIERRVDTSGDHFRITIGKCEYEKREEAGQALKGILGSVNLGKKVGRQDIGTFAGFTVEVVKDWGDAYLVLRSPNHATYTVNGGDTAIGLVRSMENTLSRLPERLEKAGQQLAQKEADLVTLTKGLDKEFDYELELAALLVRKQEIDTELGLNKSDKQVLEGDKEGDTEEAPETTEPEEEDASDVDSVRETEGLIDLDEIGTIDAGWDWQGAEWDTAARCEATPELVEFLERLRSGDFAEAESQPEIVIDRVEPEIEKPEMEQAESLDTPSWEERRRELVEVHMLPDRFVDALHNLGLVRADGFGNRPYNQLILPGVAAGQAQEGRSFWFQIGRNQPSRVLITDSPLEALVLSALDRRQVGAGTVYMSGEVPQQMLAKFAQQGGHVYAAYENSPEGEQRAWELAKELPQVQRRRPERGSWSAQIQRSSATPIETQEWLRMAKALAHSEKYLSQVQAVSTQAPDAKQALQRDKEAFDNVQNRLWSWHHAARETNANPQYLSKVAEVAIAFNASSPQPLSEEAKRAMEQVISYHASRQTKSREFELEAG